MSLLQTSRRWKLTAADIPILVLGCLFIAGALIIIWQTSDGPIPLFWASASLTVGAAIAIVGLVLRFQLDLEDELDEAKQARIVFEASLRQDIGVINERVREALSRLPAANDNEALRRAEQRSDDLKDELDAARVVVRRLEAELRKPRLRQRAIVDVLAELTVPNKQSRVTDAGPHAPAAKGRLRTFGRTIEQLLVVVGSKMLLPSVWGLLRAFGRRIDQLLVVVIIKMRLPLVLVCGAVGLLVGWLAMRFMPYAHHPLGGLDRRHWQWWPKGSSSIVNHKSSRILPLGAEPGIFAAVLTFAVLTLRRKRRQWWFTTLSVALAVAVINAYVLVVSFGQW